jgi:hypothetical protein
MRPLDDASLGRYFSIRLLDETSRGCFAPWIIHPSFVCPKMLAQSTGDLRTPGDTTPAIQQEMQVVIGSRTGHFQHIFQINTKTLI